MTLNSDRQKQFPRGWERVRLGNRIRQEQDFRDVESLKNWVGYSPLLRIRKSRQAVIAQNGLLYVVYASESFLEQFSRDIMLAVKVCLHYVEKWLMEVGESNCSIGSTLATLSFVKCIHYMLIVDE